MADVPPIVPDATLFEGLLEAAPDAIVITDSGGRILLVNAQAEHMFGYPRGEMLGQSIELLVPERFHAHAAHRAAYFASASVRPMGAGIELFARRRDGSEFPVEISLSPLRTERGALAIAAVRDITDRKRAHEERARLLQVQAASADANRMKDEFLATLSHELRTPLNAILGYARMLRTGAVADERRTRALEIIDRNATALAQLVADVLDVSRIITGKVRLDIQACDLPELVERAIEAVRPTIEAKQLRLTKSLDPRAGPVSGDPNRLLQVFWNLLSNAVKFTPEGGRIDVRLSRLNAHVELTVSDTGIGIPPEFLPCMFERFRQVDTRFSREFGGLGLGLALVRQFVELHGGTVVARSAGHGQGATFTINLPVMTGHRAQVPGDRPSLSEAKSMEAGLTGVRVLAIDDEDDALGLVSDLLSDAGARVVTAHSGPEGLHLVHSYETDVIVCDIAMPQMDGYQFIRALRGGEGTASNLPAVALTAHARSEDRARSLMAGFQLHLAKPVDPNELVAAVKSLTTRPAG